jgi:hypothetical protein
MYLTSDEQEKDFATRKQSCTKELQNMVVFEGAKKGKNSVCVNDPYTEEVKEIIRRVIYNRISQRVEYFEVC